MAAKDCRKKQKKRKGIFLCSPFIAVPTIPLYVEQTFDSQKVMFQHVSMYETRSRKNIPNFDDTNNWKEVWIVFFSPSGVDAMRNNENNLKFVRFQYF